MTTSTSSVTSASPTSTARPGGCGSTATSATPRELDLPALRALPTVDVPAVLECFGNPLEPGVLMRRAANVVWHGVPVAELLEAAGAAPVSALWATGADAGVFADVACTEYRKDVPLEVARERGIVALGMNEDDAHGGPARFVVPGYFGTNNVKWLRALTVADRRPEHLFTTRLYQRTMPGEPGPQPVRDLDVTSVITAPVDGARADRAVEVSGWAWGAWPVASVEVGVDGRWRSATLEARGEHRTWAALRPRPRAAAGRARARRPRHRRAGARPAPRRGAQRRARGAGGGRGRSRLPSRRRATASRVKTFAGDRRWS